MSSTKRNPLQVKYSPRINKILLVLNVILFFTALVISVLDVNVKEYIQAVAMLFVMFLTGANAYGCWKRLKGKTQ